MEKITPKRFINHLLSGVALAIVAGLVPNAILGELFKYLSQYHAIFVTLHQVVVSIQFTVPVLVGALIAVQFKLKPLSVAIVASAAFVGSGVAHFKSGAWVLIGVGDLINTILTAAIAVLFILMIGERLGSLSFVLLPTFVGGGAAFIGVLTLPFVAKITTGIGAMINSFTELQPILMTMLIALTFSFIIISPLSTVAISLAIGISGYAAGAASLGIAACEAALVIGTMRVNGPGVPITIFLGGVKMMIPNMIKHPIILLPIFTTAVVTGVVGSVIGIAGTKTSAGFGIIGMIGPINAYRFLEYAPWLNILLITLAFFIVPFIVAIVADIVYRKWLRLYDLNIFKFEL